MVGGACRWPQRRVTAVRDRKHRTQTRMHAVTATAHGSLPHAEGRAEATGEVWRPKFVFCSRSLSAATPEAPGPPISHSPNPPQELTTCLAHQIHHSLNPPSIQTEFITTGIICTKSLRPPHGGLDTDHLMRVRGGTREEGVLSQSEDTAS